MTQILVDADACPVVRLVEQAAKQFGLPVTLLCDTNHILQSDYSEVRVIGAGADAVDFALFNLCHAGDVVVTQDYGVAAMALGKGAYAIHQSGRLYTDENIDQLLMERHLARKARQSGKHHLRGPRKRTPEDDHAHGIACFDGAADTNEQHAKAEPLHDGFTHALGDALAQEQTQGGAGDDGGKVDQRSDHEQHFFRK